MPVRSGLAGRVWPDAGDDVEMDSTAGGEDCSSMRSGLGGVGSVDSDDDVVHGNAPLLMVAGPVVGGEVIVLGGGHGSVTVASEVR